MKKALTILWVVVTSAVVFQGIDNRVDGTRLDDLEAGQIRQIAADSAFVDSLRTHPKYQPVARSYVFHDDMGFIQGIHTRIDSVVEQNGADMLDLKIRIYNLRQIIERYEREKQVNEPYEGVYLDNLR